MTYTAYRGVKIINGKKQFGPWHTSYNGMQTGFQGAFRELKSKEKGWDYLIIEHFSNYSKVYTDYYLAFVDKDGVFGKKNGMLVVRTKDAKGSLSAKAIIKYGEYYDYNGCGVPVKDYLRRKNKTTEFGMPDNWHPFGL